MPELTDEEIKELRPASEVFAEWGWRIPFLLSAVLFSINDRPVMESLQLYREEAAH